VVSLSIASFFSSSLMFWEVPGNGLGACPSRLRVRLFWRVAQTVSLVVASLPRLPPASASPFAR
jgi:hypothetical protein